MDLAGALRIVCGHGLPVVLGQVRPQMGPCSDQIGTLQVVLYLTERVALHLFRDWEGRLQWVRNYGHHARYRGLLVRALRFGSSRQVCEEYMGQDVGLTDEDG